MHFRHTSTLTIFNFRHTLILVMANNLSREKQIGVISALVDGCSIRSTERMTGVNRETTGTLLLRVGDGCADLMDEKMRVLGCGRLEIDELWAFVGKKQRHVTLEDDSSRVGDTWTFVAIDTKLVPSFLVGKRDAESADTFIRDVASRLRNRVQISTDGLHAYIADRGGVRRHGRRLRATSQDLRN